VPTELERKDMDMTVPNLQDRFESMVDPDWVREIREHYLRTGAYRPEDLFRLLGEPNYGLETGGHLDLGRNVAPTHR
jgi:hypothetical protein